MTTPNGPGRQLFDNANVRMRHDIPSDLDIGKVPVPGGEIGFATIRQGNTTLSVPLDHAGASQWADLLCQLRDMLSASGKIVVAQPGAIIPAGAGQRG
jgi:hypothetical protein